MNSSRIGTDIRPLAVAAALLAALLLLCGCAGGDTQSAAQMDSGETTYLKMLSAAEEETAIEKLGIAEPDAELTADDCFSARLYVNGSAKVFFGRVTKSAGESGYLFSDLFTGEELFIYSTVGRDEDQPTAFSGGPYALELQPLHPYLSAGSCYLDGVATALSATVFLNADVFTWDNEADTRFFSELVRDAESGDEITVAEMARIYVNLIPEEMRLTKAELDAARDGTGASGAGTEALDTETAGDALDTETAGDEGTKHRPLSEAEEAAAIDALGIEEAEDIDQVLLWGHCYSVNMYVNGEPKIMFGTVFYTNRDGEYRFADLFTGEDLFIYRTTSDAGLSVTWESRDKGPLEFRPLHPYFFANECELVYISYSTISMNFLSELGIVDYENEADLKYMFEFVPQSIDNRAETSVEEQAHIYVNLIPEEMRLTKAELDAAARQQGDEPVPDEWLGGKGEETPAPGSEAHLKMLSSAEESAAMRKLRLAEPDAELSFADCYAACLAGPDGSSRILFGSVSETDGEDMYIFSDLFTGEELFAYKAAGDGTPEVYLDESGAFRPIHPFFSGGEWRLEGVMNSMWATGFLVDRGAFSWDSKADTDIYYGLFPRSLDLAEMTSVKAQAHVYLNLIPKEMWVTSEELDAAKG